MKTKQKLTQVGLLLGHKLLQVLQYLGDHLRVLRDAAQLLLVEVGRDLLAQQYLAYHIAQVRRAGAVF